MTGIGRGTEPGRAVGALGIPGVSVARIGPDLLSGVWTQTHFAQGHSIKAIEFPGNPACKLGANFTIRERVIGAAVPRVKFVTPVTEPNSARKRKTRSEKRQGQAMRVGFLAVRAMIGMTGRGVRRWRFRWRRRVY